MNWDAIGALGQMLGSIAVFVTLGYLAGQVRYARTETRRALSQGRAEAARDILARQTLDRINSAHLKAEAALGGVHSPFMTALIEQAGLMEEEASLLHWTQYSWWMYRLQIIPHVDELTPMERRSFDSSLAANYGLPGVHRLFYETQIKPFAHPDAIHYVESVVAEFTLPDNKAQGAG